MCVQSCLCNSCFKKNTCSDCEYIKEHEKDNCYIGGVTECENYMIRGNK